MSYDEELVERVREALAAEENVHERSMFGGCAFLVNGRMAVAASSSGGLMVRVDPSERQSLLGKPGTEPFRMNGREMKGWIHVDLDGVRTRAALQRWTTIGLTYARSLPAK